MSGTAVTRFEFVVYGDPATQGSKKAFVNPKTGKAVVVDDNKKPLRTWRQNVAAAAAQARAAAGADTIDGPVLLDVTFYLRRPQSAPKRVRLPWRQPDLDKLLRSVKDALRTAGVYRDDARVTDAVTRKRFGHELGAHILVEAIDEATFDLVGQAEPAPVEVQARSLWDVIGMDRRAPASRVTPRSAGWSRRPASACSLDVEPRDDGNLVFTGRWGAGGNAREVRYLRAGETPPDATQRWVSHFTSCPHAAEHRKAKT